MVRTGEAALNIYRFLDSLGAVQSALSTLPAVGRRPDAILFFNGARNQNQGCLVDWASGAQQDYLVNAETLAVVWLEDVPDDSYQIRAKLQKRRHSFVEDLAIVSGVAGKLMGTPGGAFGFVGQELPGDFPEYSVTAEFLHSPAPSEIAVTIKQLSRSPSPDSLMVYGDFDDVIAVDEKGVLFYTSTDLVVRNVQKKYVGLAVGASLVSVNTRLISASPGNADLLTVNRGAESNLQGKAMILVFAQLGRDPGWRPSMQPWRSRFYLDIPKRLSLQAGAEISQRPLGRVFTGVGFGLNRHIDLIGGLAFRDEPKEDGTIRRDAVSELSDLNDLVPTSYERRWFFGLSLRASALAP